MNKDTPESILSIIDSIDRFQFTELQKKVNWRGDISLANSLGIPDDVYLNEMSLGRYKSKLWNMYHYMAA